MSLAVFLPIETDRLVLRPVVENDIPALLGINSDDDVTRFLTYRSWRSLADGMAWLERVRSVMVTGSALQLVLARKDTEDVVGAVVLFHYDGVAGLGEIGYVIGKRFWRQGFAREALIAIIDHAFVDLGLRRLEAEVDPANLASMRLLESLRFMQEGLLSQKRLAKGLCSDSAVYGLLREAWCP